MTEKPFDGHYLQSRGFTLVELAVVITLIALVIGGVMVGRNIIRNTQIQNILVEEGKLESAVQQFQVKYNYLPGDFPNATTMWGTHSAGCAVGNSNVRQRGTCNGNGNGTMPAIEAFEYLSAWQHLANEGLITGSYTGGGYNGLTIWAGLNSPMVSGLDGGAFLIQYIGVPGFSYFSGDFGHPLWYMFDHINAAKVGILTPAEARLLDTKADDGLPGMGKIYGYGGTVGATRCMTSYTNATSTYDLAITDTTCNLLFKTPF